MSNPQSGFGRGGRGAALAQLLNQQVRRPGDQPEVVPPQQVAPTPGIVNGIDTKPADLSNNNLPSQPSLVRTVSPAVAEVPMQAPISQVPIRPTGRGALLQRVLESQSPATLTPISTPIPPAQHAVGFSQRQPVSETQAMRPPSSQQQSVVNTRPPSEQSQRPPSQQSIASARPVSRQSVISSVPSTEPLAQGGMRDIAAALPPASHLPSEGGDNKRESFQQRMLTQLNTEKPPVVRSGTVGERVPLMCNYIALKSKLKGVYQYAVAFSPEVDSLFVRHRLIEDASEIFGSVKSFDGRILFLPIQLANKETIVSSKMPTDGSPVRVVVKLVNVLPPSSCLQLFNITFRKALSKLKMCQVGRDYFLPEGAIPIPQHKLEVWPGYITAIDEYEGGLLMLTDVKHKVLRTQTVLDIIVECVNTNRVGFKDLVAKKLIGSIVLTRYNNRNYRIEDIAWDKSPKLKFPASDGTEISYVEYYKKAYNKDIRDYDQPLLISKVKKDKERGKRQSKLAGMMICLIPEFCFMTGLTDDMRADFRVMKDLSTHTRVPPAARRRSLCQLTSALNKNEAARAEFDKWGLMIDNDIMQLDGRLLPSERIYYGRNQDGGSGAEADWSRDATRNQVITPVDLCNWMVVVDQRNQAHVTEFVKTYRKCSEDMGIRVNQPQISCIPNDRTETYLKEIRDKLNPQCQLVVAVFPSSRDDRYSAIKKLCCVDSPVPSQVINAKTISDQRKLRSVSQKIALQINCKLGGELWSVKIPTAGLMVCGIDTYHDASMKSGSMAGFVSSTNESCTRWYSRVCGQNPHEELINGLMPCFTNAIRKYHEVNHKLPKWIFMFRDGVGDGQLNYTAQFEVPQLSESFKHFGADYCPKLAVIIVQKRINQRIFKMGRNNELDNPNPGTILDHTVTRRNWADFFLVSQHVRQGTVSPTHYVIVYDSTALPIDKIQSITYKMTHLYYNWPGTVRVPAPCQYAHKLAYLVGQNIRRAPSEQLSDRLFFL